MGMFTGKKKRTINWLRQRYGTKPQDQVNDFELISIYYNLVKKKLVMDTIDEITWNDLEMDKVFERINHTSTYIGEQTLYKQLHILSGGTEFGCSEENEELEKMIRYIAGNEAQRLELQFSLGSIGKSEPNYHLPTFLFHAKELSISNVWFYRLLQILLFVSFFAGILFDLGVCLIVATAVALINLNLYMVNKAKYESYIHSLISTKYMVRFAKLMLKNPIYKEIFGADKLPHAVNELKQLVHLIGNFQAKKSSVWTGDIFGILRDYLIGMTLWDLTVFKKITNIIYGKLDDLLTLYEFIGKVDMAVSIASFRTSLPYYCKPGFSEVRVIEAEKLYHPLIDEPVSNELVLRDSCVITGSNASGKSTFIKAVAINAILAHNINTCMAAKFRLCKMNVMTSMTVRDNLTAGESFYIKELKYLKRIVDKVSCEVPTLCIIDEILRGTNTQERLASSEAILKYLSEKNSIVIVATHDMELAKSLKGSYHCFYFCNSIESGKVVFDYKIHQGYSQTQNAIKLLHHIGYPKKIIEMAEKLNQKSNLNIRMLSESELKSAVELVWRVFKEFEAPDYSEDGTLEFYRSIHDPEFLSQLTWHGAYLKQELAGVIATRSGGSHIALFFVDGTYQGQGIGRKLEQTVEKQNTGDRMTVNASPVAVPIYHHLGYKDTDSEQTVRGIRFTPMEKSKEVLDA